MLISVVIGGKPECTDWVTTSDKFGADYITSKAYNQKIRLGRNVDDKLISIISESRDFGCLFAQTFDIAENIDLGINNRNLNLTLLNHHQSDDEDVIHSDPDIISIVIDNSKYKMIAYNANNNDIIHTTKKREFSQGAHGYVDKYQTAILRTIIYKDNQHIINFTLYDINTGKFMYVNVYVDFSGEASFELIDINNGKKVKALTRELKKHLYFRVDVGRNELLSNTYITTSEMAGKVEELIKDRIPNYQIIELDNYDPNDESTKEILKKALIDERIRVVTEVGVRLDKEFSKAYKLLYVFDLVIEKDDSFKLKCIKSN